MENLKKTLGSGAIIEVSLASFPEGNRLFKAVSKHLEDINLSLDTVQKMAMRFIASDEIEAALWPCMARGKYNNLKINPDLFEDPKVREDYVEVLKEVMVYNLTPFFKSLVLVLAGLEKTNIDTPK